MFGVEGLLTSYVGIIGKGPSGLKLITFPATYTLGSILTINHIQSMYTVCIPQSKYTCYNYIYIYIYIIV